MADTRIGGRYTPLQRHASGGMSTLWRALDERTGEVVALKRLHPFVIADPDARERLIREAAALESVDHPAVVRPRELLDDPDDPCLVMEFARGRALDAILAEEGRLDANEAAAIAGTVADALAAAHQAGVLHRDVKPANIVVEGDGAVHLVDFGIASLDPAIGTGLTAPRTVLGTLRYTAPERLAGRPATPQSDVWALGAVLYEMVTGRSVVSGTAALVVFSGEAHLPPPTDDLPRALAAIVRRALSPKPEDRYPDAASMRDALFELEDVTPTDAFADAPTVPIPVASTLRPATPSHRPSVGGWPSPVDRAASVFFGVVMAVALSAMLLLGLVGGGGGVADGSVRADTEPLPSSSPAAPPTVGATPPPAEGDGAGRGKDNGGGNGKGKGRDRNEGKGD
jgi:serine/threonine protein kinase